MTDQFVSYAQNGEDVVLWRALGHVEEGCYVDVGAMHPADDSVTKAFYDRGWRGLSIEPIPASAKRFSVERPDDEVLQVAITAESGQTVRMYNVLDTGLSTLMPELAEGYSEDGFEVEGLDVRTLTLADAVEASSLVGRDVHFLKVDVEAGEADVLAGVDLTSWRPWILVIEATLPNSTETAHEAWEPRVLASGYQFCLFDGLNRFYVAAEHPELAAAISVPASVADRFVRRREQKALVEARSQVVAVLHELEEVQRASALAAAERQPDRALVERLWKDVAYWRAAALDAWAEAASVPHREVELVRATANAELAGVRRRLQEHKTRLAARRQELEDKKKRLAARRQKLDEVRAQLAEMSRQARANARRADDLQAEIDRLLDTVSWRITRPLRGARRAQFRTKDRRA